MTTDPKTPDLMANVIALCKRRGFIFQGSDIYGGLAGTWDYGPLGVALKNNIKNLWWKQFVDSREDMYPIDAAILMNQDVWKASGHVSGFSDPLVACQKCKHRFRADQLENKTKCPDCGGKLGEEKQFNMMFETRVGATEEAGAVSYLRPETAQGMFVNFKNVVDAFHPKLPFGLAQIGKAFRNEIAPRDFLFRAREFEQMEIEYFVRPEGWQATFEEFRNEILKWTDSIGLDRGKVHELELPDGERAHYSARTIDFEYDFPFGRKELYGLAYRTNFDLTRHADASSADFMWKDETIDEPFVPHVIEPSFGLDRTVLAVLSDAYTEDMMGDEKRIYLKLKPALAPIRVAVFPLLKNKPALVEKAYSIFKTLKSEFGAVAFDDNGNIGKRYRRQDEIGTVTAVTVDFETLDNDTVTLRDRDSSKQVRIKVPMLIETVSEIIKGKLFSELTDEIK